MFRKKARCVAAEIFISQICCMGWFQMTLYKLLLVNSKNNMKNTQLAVYIATSMFLNIFEEFSTAIHLYRM